MSGKTNAWIARLHRYSDRWWYFPALGLLAGADFFVAFIPTDGLLVSSVMLNPRRWIRASICVAVGSALGSVAVAAVLREHGPGAVERIFGQGILLSPSWVKTRALLDNHGIWAIFGMAVGPLPMVPISVLAGFTTLPLATIFWASLAGRGLKYFAFSWAATHAPGLFTRFFKAPKREAEGIVEKNP